MATTSCPPPLKVLFPIHPLIDALDFIGPFETLTHAHYFDGPSAKSDVTPPETRAFHCTITASTPTVLSDQNVTFSRHIPISEAYASLASYDVLVIPGGNTSFLLETKPEPLGLIKAFAQLPKREDGRGRFLLSVCTGSLFLATQGVLKGLTATTHPAFLEKLKRVCVEGNGDEEGATRLVSSDERFVVNRVDEKGLKVITAAGISCGLDASLWLVEEVAGKEARENVESYMEYAYRSGLVIGE